MVFDDYFGKLFEFPVRIFRGIKLFAAVHPYIAYFACGNILKREIG
jgi:hypothetical protein